MLQRLEAASVGLDGEPSCGDSRGPVPDLPSLLVLADSLQHTRGRLGGDPLVGEVPL